MNKKKIIITWLACGITPLVMNAQENLIKAMDNFVNSKDNSEYITTNVFTEKRQKAKNSLTYCHSYWFDMPVNMKKKIEPLRNAFNKDMDKAYNVMIKSAGSNSTDKMNIAYGDKLEKQVQFGAHQDHNYMVMLVRDNQDSLKRYCYAVTWYIDKNKNRLCGSIFKIYGKDPAIRRSFRTFYSTDQYGNWTLTDPDDNDKRMLIKIGQETIKSDIDFLQIFGNLTVAYKKNISDEEDNETLLIGLANKILEVCRKKGVLLNKNEKLICADTLKELQKMTYSKYLSGLLSEAATSLKN